MPKRLSHVQAALDQLKAPGVFSLADAAAVGISQPTLSRLAAREEVIRLGDGYYAHPEGEDMAPGTFQWIVACARFGPRSLIGGMTALFHYHLIPQVPNQVWVVVPPEKKSTKSVPSPTLWRSVAISSTRILTMKLPLGHRRATNRGSSTLRTVSAFHIFCS